MIKKSSDAREIDQLNDFVTVNLSTYFDVDRKFRLTFAVSNLMNRVGEYYRGIVIPASYATAIGGDLIGRRFSVTARARFGPAARKN